MLKISRIIFCVLIAFAVAIACEGPAGADGPQGSEGPEGPIGPAGEDGSMMYAGQGVPGSGIGDLGDYYLNQDTGELYGPKNEDGWGNPIIVLMGEDGQNGADGADGEDGSQIYSGSGAPDASLGTEGDFYLDKDNSDLYGPKTSNGWGSPLNLKGADGNANVTRYIFPGHNFESSFVAQVSIGGVSSEDEMRQNTWIPYLIDNGDYFHVPGPIGPNVDLYGVKHNWNTYNSVQPVLISIILREGTGDTFTQIEVVRIEAGNTEDMSKQKDSIIPDHLDTSNYEAVAEYYSFYK